MKRAFAVLGLVLASMIVAPAAGATTLAWRRPMH